MKMKKNWTCVRKVYIGPQIIIIKSESRQTNTAKFRCKDKKREYILGRELK